MELIALLMFYVGTGGGEKEGMSERTREGGGGGGRDGGPLYALESKETIKQSRRVTEPRELPRDVISPKDSISSPPSHHRVRR